MPKYVVECELGGDIFERVVGEIATTVRPLPRTDLPSYVSKLAADNTELSETVSDLRDALRDIQHALDMSLESKLCDVLSRIRHLKKRHAELKSVVDEFVLDLENREFVKVGGEE